MLAIFETILKNAEAANPIENGDYIGNDGLYYCGNCNTPKEMLTELGGEACKMRIPCECKNAIYEAEEKAKAAEKEMRRLDELCKACIPDEKHRRSTFAADDGRAPEAVAAARWYVENFSQLYTENKGLMFIGDRGTGKTFAACCIANAIIYTNRRVFVRKMLSLLNDVGNFDTRAAALDDIAKPDLLILDDFGVTKNSEHNISLLYEIIDTRYRSNKPLIITTNLGTNELKNPPSMELGRIYDRVIEMCMCERSPVILTGKSLRADIAAAKHNGTI